jgi:uncharacterized protein (DUF849 family)
MVNWAVELIDHLGADLATPGEARKMLGLKN